MIVHRGSVVHIADTRFSHHDVPCAVALIVGPELAVVASHSDAARRIYLNVSMANAEGRLHAPEDCGAGPISAVDQYGEGIGPVRPFDDAPETESELRAAYGDR